MGILILAVLAGSAGFLVAWISGYGLAMSLAVYVLAGLASIPVLVLPLLGLCALRKRLLRRELT